MEAFDAFVANIHEDSPPKEYTTQLSEKLIELITCSGDDQTILQALQNLEEKTIKLVDGHHSVGAALIPFTLVCAGKSS